jgi:hypothetical protein
MTLQPEGVEFFNANSEVKAYRQDETKSQFATLRRGL